MKTVKFINYSGKYPNLCGGVLHYEIIFDNGRHEIHQTEIKSGGECFYNHNTNDIIQKYGDWKLSEKKFLPYKLQIELLNQVNNIVPKGCCGGCG